MMTTRTTTSSRVGDSRARILLVTQSLPWPPKSGGQQRTFFLHRALSTLGVVDVLLLRRLDDPRFLARLNERCRVLNMVEPLPRGRRGGWRILRPIAPGLVDKLATALGRRAVDYQPDPRVAPALEEMLTREPYDLVVGRFVRPTAISGALRCSPLIIDVDDVDFVRYQTWLNRPGVDPATRGIVGWHNRQVRRLLPGVVAQADHLWVAGQADVELLDHPAVSVLPNVPYPAALGEDRRLPPASPDSKVILFVGIAHHRVNVEGVRRFVGQCWPRIREAVPEAVFRVVGGGPWSSLAPELARKPGVDLRGFVGNLNEVYRDAAFTIVPLFEGAGSKIKVLEALSYGRTQAAAAPALRGFDHLLHHDRSLLVAEDDDQLAGQCVRLLRSPAERDRLARHGHEVVMKHFTFETFRESVTRDVGRVLGGKREASGPSDAGPADEHTRGPDRYHRR